MPRKRKTPYPTDSDQRELKVETGSSPPGCHTGDEEGPPGWHHRDDESLRRQSGEAVPRDFNLPDSRKPVGAPRTRESKFSPAPSHFPRGPPGFDNESRFSPSPIHFPAVPSNPPGFDKSDSFHGVKMIYQESLEITSDRPFLPQRRAPPGGSNMSSPHVRIPRGDKQGDRVELHGLSRSPLTSVAAEESNAQETPEGGSRKSLSVGKIRKKMQPSTNDDQPAHAGMYKNQLQELAQRSCFNLPAYARIREGPDHAPRFKATVNFNGEVFESPNYCNTLRQAEHAAAEVALNTLSRRGPSQSLAARILDETGVCKNLLQETAQRAGVSLPVYATTRSGPGHLPVFTCTVEVASMTFNGEAAKTKKQAEKNAAMAAWSALKQFANQGRAVSLPTETQVSDEQEQNTIARALALHYGKETQQLTQGAQNPSGNVIPIRLRSMSSREGLQTGSTLSSQGHPGSWVPEMCNEQQRHMRSQPHSNVGALPPPAYRSVGLSRPGSSVILRDVTGHRDPTVLRDANAIRDAAIAKRAVERAMGANFGGRHAPVNLRPVQIRRDRHEVAVPYDDHQRDEDEWLRGESSKSNRDADGRNDSLEKEHGSAVVHGSYNPMSWSGSGSSHNWWSNMHPPTMPRGAAMPVVLRPAVMVCAAPPRRPEPDDAETEGEAATRQVLSQLSL